MAVKSIKFPSVTADTTMCNTKLSDFIISSISCLTSYINFHLKKIPEDAQNQSIAQLGVWIGMHLGWEHRKTGWVLLVFILMSFLDMLSGNILLYRPWDIQWSTKDNQRSVQEVAFSNVFFKKVILPAKVWNQLLKFLLWGVQQTDCQKMYITLHGEASSFQPWWSVRDGVPAFDANQWSLPGLIFCSNLLWMGLAGSGTCKYTVWSL